jgi:hypothetical protein
MNLKNCAFLSMLFGRKAGTPNDAQQYPGGGTRTAAGV